MIQPGPRTLSPGPPPSPARLIVLSIRMISGSGRLNSYRTRARECFTPRARAGAIIDAPSKETSVTGPPDPSGPTRPGPRRPRASCRPGQVRHRAGPAVRGSVGRPPAGRPGRRRPTRPAGRRGVVPPFRGPRARGQHLAFGRPRRPPSRRSAPRPPGWTALLSMPGASQTPPPGRRDRPPVPTRDPRRPPAGPSVPTMTEMCPASAPRPSTSSATMTSSATIAVVMLPLRGSPPASTHRAFVRDPDSWDRVPRARTR
jgi:hypothetical protein